MINREKRPVYEGRDRSFSFFYISFRQIGAREGRRQPVFFSFFFLVISPHINIYSGFKLFPPRLLAQAYLKFSFSYCYFKSAVLVQHYRTR